MQCTWNRPSLPRAIIAGLLATVAMDLGGRAIVAPVLGVEPPDPRSLARWVASIRHGRFTHPDIAAAPAVNNEAMIGVAAHYAIGGALGAGFGLFLHAIGPRRGLLSLAFAYGTGTTVFAWFVMFPATGQGVMGRGRGPRLAALSLGNHALYGLGLGAAMARLVRPERSGQCR